MTWNVVSSRLSNTQHQELETAAKDPKSLKSYLLQLKPVDCLCALSEVLVNEYITLGGISPNADWRIITPFIIRKAVFEMNSKLTPLFCAMFTDTEVRAHISKLIDPKQTFESPYDIEITRLYVYLNYPVEVA